MSLEANIASAPVFIAAFRLNDSIVVMSIRQIDLKIGSSAKLTLVAELVLDLTDTIGRHPLSIHLRGDNLVLWWKPYVLVWNWVKNTGCRWLARDNYLSGSVSLCPDSCRTP